MGRGRPAVGVSKEFIKEYDKFRSGGYGDISKKQFAKLKGISISTFYRYENSLKAVNRQEKKDLKTLADDSGLLHRKEVQDIIENCKSYEEGQQRIMRIYTAVYMH